MYFLHSSEHFLVRRSLGGRRALALVFMLYWLGCPPVGFAALQKLGRTSESVDWAVKKLVSSLRDAGITAGDEDIVLQRELPGAPAESFSIAFRGTQILVSGKDSNGEMYGVLELAEQIGNAHAHGSWAKLVSEVKPTTQSPYTRIRADNSFLHHTPSAFGQLLERLHFRCTPSLFPDMAMWERYIDMLASNRFNVLDLHGGYNIPTTRFFNLLPVLVSVPGYGNMGTSRSQKKNLAGLRHLVRYARKRGIEISLMNYSARIPGVSGSRLADYTRKAVSILLKELPELKRVGFRLGESGEELAFFNETYVRAILETKRSDVRLYTRSWRASPVDTEAVAKAMGGNLDVEIKYNGEHLGLPYQGIFGPTHKRYGYEDFLRPKVHYRVLWQVRANGTHRYWTWAQTEFIRRTVRTFRFGGADGFSLEPPTAYFSFAAADYYSAPADKEVYGYIWEKHWPWYFAWGRLSYNPDLPEQTLVAPYTKRFGEAGSDIYRALQQSGLIVPLALSYRFTGPDHRNMSPETQTGAFDPEKSEPIDLLSFARNTPLDSRSFVGIDSFVKGKIAGQSDGRIGPAHLARIFTNAAAEARAKVASVAGLTGRAAAEWRLMRTDIMGASYLGEYYAARTLGTMYLDHALSVDNRDDYKKALQYLDQSRLSWGQLSQVCDSAYQPLNDPLIRQSAFTWRSQIAPLRLLDATAESLWRKAARLPPGPPLVLTPREKGEPFQISIGEVMQEPMANGTIAITCRPTPFSETKNVVLWWKDKTGFAKWNSAPMIRNADGSFRAEFPTNSEGSLCLFEITNTLDESAQWPPVLRTVPYLEITPSPTPTRIEGSPYSPGAPEAGAGSEGQYPTAIALFIPWRSSLGAKGMSRACLAERNLPRRK
jgi:hypothetical protein